MDEARKKQIIAKAKQCMDVLAQVPMLADPRARDAGNLVWRCCRKATCLSGEEENVWDEVFDGMMPLNALDADKFKKALEGKDGNEA